MKNIKKRAWGGVIYPESLPENWLEILQNSGLQIAISPLHDKDINPDGTPKKPHYHIIIIYDGPTTFNNVKTFLEQLNAPNPIPLEQVRGYYRYLIHKDNPEKYQYDETQIKALNGFDFMNYVELTSAEINSIKKEIQKIIIKNHINEYCVLLDFLLDNDLNNYWDVASNHTIFFNTYITSRRHKLNSEIQDLLT